MKDSDKEHISFLYVLIAEGKKETAAYLEKNAAEQSFVNFFTKQDKKGKPIFPTDHAIVLFNWIKDSPVNLNDLEQTYADFIKYFPGKNIKDFGSYNNFADQVHAKVEEKRYNKRHKETSKEATEATTVTSDKEDVLADDENVLILKADSEHKCVKYGKGYSFCISRPGGGNMYGNYRLTDESTFYFVFFKKVPKDNPKHIMVLDRTKDGWKWTFGENNTKMIQGGWNEVVERFPFLAKYENKFVRNPLTNEEREYQKKLADFTSNPTKEKFETFSYKEKADVLKFGMHLPVGLFDSLDKFLRNEYISVGPSINVDTFHKLNDNEKRRFLKVRKQILEQQQPESEHDMELIKSDPELYEKYIKPEEKEAEIFYQKYKNLKTISGDLAYKLNYIPLFLPELQSCGNINTTAIIINLPNLRTCGYIEADEAKELNLPLLQKSSYIEVPYGKKVTIPKPMAKYINAPRDCQIHYSEEDFVQESFKLFFTKNTTKEQ